MLAVANYHPRVPNPSTEQPRAADREPPVSSRHSRTQSPSPEPRTPTRTPSPEPRAPSPELTNLSSVLVFMTTAVVKERMHMAESIGEQELALLRHIADRGTATVGEAADQIGTPRGLARSTVLTMMERLRGKGYLGRRMADGIYRYRARESSADLLKGAVERFIERNLDGLVSPFLAYLSEAGRLSDAELAELEAIVARLTADWIDRSGERTGNGHGGNSRACIGRRRYPRRRGLGLFTPSPVVARNANRPLVVCGRQVRPRARLDDADSHPGAPGRDDCAPGG